jgi:hypothetical protein
MFTGFPTENTPAIQIWDYFRTTQSGSASISLTDDCAPIQLFRTGGSITSPIALYLPTAPIDGKSIKIINQRYSSNTLTQEVRIYSSDRSGSGASANIYTVGQGGFIELIFVKNAVTFGTGTGSTQSGWISLSESSVSAANYRSIALGGGSAVRNNGIAIGSDSQGGFAYSTGQGAVAIGGSYATGTDSFAAAIGGMNTSYGATGANSIAIGYRAVASGTQSCVIGGGSGASSGAAVGNAGGAFNAYGGDTTGGILLGGDSPRAERSRSVAIGGGSSWANVVGKLAMGAASNFTGLRADLGNCQTGILVLRTQTTSATAGTLTGDTNSASTANQLILPDNSAFAFQGLVVAKQQSAGGTQSAAWKFEGLLRRDGSAATTTLITSTVTAISNAPGWTFAISADTGNGGLLMTGTGAAATNIRWVATVYTSETIYA